MQNKIGIAKYLSFENLLLFILYVTALWPLRNIGLAIGDDVTLYAHCFSGHWHLLVDNFILSNGRFYLTFMRYVFALPYLFDSRLWFMFWYITPFALCFWLFVLLVKRLFHSEALTLFCALFFACYFQVIGWHSITTCYPFYFTFAFALLLWAMHLFLSYYEKKKKKYLIFSSVIMFLTTLFYESFLMYYLLFAAIAFWKNRKFPLRTKKKIIQTTKDLLPFVFGGIIYLIAYFVFQHFYPPTYFGVDMQKHLTIWGLIVSMFNMARESFPLQVYTLHKGMLNIYSTFNDSYYYIWRADLLSYIKGSIAVVLFYYLTNKYNQKIKYSSLLLVCLSKKYYLSWNNSYVPTFYTFFGFALCFSAIVFAFINLMTIKKWTLNVAKVLIAFVIFIITIITQMTNTSTSQDLACSQIRMDMAKEVFSQRSIPNITTQTPICLEQLHHTTSSMGENITMPLHWSEFFQKETGSLFNLYDKYFDFYDANKTNSSVVWTGFFWQAAKDNDALLWFAPTQGISLPMMQKNIICDSLVGFYHSPFKTYNVSIVSTQPQDSVWANDTLMNSNGNYHNLNISFPIKRGKENTVFSIRGKGLIPSSLSVSNILMQ